MQSGFAYSFNLSMCFGIPPQRGAVRDQLKNITARVAPLNSPRLGHIPQLPAGVPAPPRGELPAVVCPR